MSKTSDFSCLSRLRCAPAACVVLVLALPVRAEPAPAPNTASEPAVSKPAAAVLPRIGLRAALAEALSRELRVRLAQSDVARARALLQSARAGYLPTLVGHASYTRLDKERRTPGGLTAGRDQLGLDVTLNVPVFAPKAWNDASYASANAQVAERDLEDVRRTVAITTAQAYLTVLAQHRGIEVTQRAVDNASAHYQFAHQRWQGGIGNQVDDVRAAQELASSNAQLERASASLYAAEEALGVMLGRDGALDVDPEFELPTAPAVEQGLREARERRSDVIADRAALAAQKSLIDDNWAEYAPLLLAQAQPFYHTPPTVALPRTGWQVQLLLSLPFYDGGARYGTIAQREAVLTARQAQLETTLRQASSEVRVGFDAARHADAALLPAKQAAGFAAQALQFASLAYEAGASTNIEVVDAERRARDADSAVVAAEDAARQARVQLLAATGHFP
jgi:outer membrane protein TolC